MQICPKIRQILCADMLYFHSSGQKLCPLHNLCPAYMGTFQKKFSCVHLLMPAFITKHSNQIISWNNVSVAILSIYKHHLQTCFCFSITQSGVHMHISACTIGEKEPSKQSSLKLLSFPCKSFLKFLIKQSITISFLYWQVSLGRLIYYFNNLP